MVKSCVLGFANIWKQYVATQIFPKQKVESGISDKASLARDIFGFLGCSIKIRSTNYTRTVRECTVIGWTLDAPA
jgi:hypothetical protein